MDNVPQGNGSPFWKGALLGGFAGIGFLLPAQISSIGWLAFVIKIFGTSCIAGASGLVSLLVTDLYNYYKPKFLESKFFKFFQKIKNKKDNGNDKKAA